MSEPFVAFSNQPCACKFTRAEDFGPAKPVELCGFHACLRDAAEGVLDFAGQPLEQDREQFEKYAAELRRLLSEFPTDCTQEPKT